MIELRAVTKRFGRFVAVEQISLAADDGAVYGLVGYNGAGKTTLLKMIAGVYLCDGGEVLLDGTPVHSRRTPARAPFLVADEPYLPTSSSPRTLRDFYRGYYPRWSDRVFLDLLDLFELDHGGRAGGFSKGMQRQLALLLALASGSRCLLLDESFDGLDLAKRTLFTRLLRLYAERRHAAVVLSSHNLRELEGVVDRVGVIEGRRLAMDAPAVELRRRYTTYHLEFVDAPAASRALDLLAAARQVRWLRAEPAACTFVAGPGGDDLVQAIPTADVGDVTRAPSTLEEVFLHGREVSVGDIDGIFA